MSNIVPSGGLSAMQELIFDLAYCCFPFFVDLLSRDWEKMEAEW